MDALYNPSSAPAAAHRFENCALKRAGKSVAMGLNTANRVRGAGRERGNLIARRFAGEAADEASMTAVDSLGFHLRLKSGDRIHGRRVAFLEEVKSGGAARTVLVEMVRQARSSQAV